MRLVITCDDVGVRTEFEGCMGEFIETMPEVVHATYSAIVEKDETLGEIYRQVMIQRVGDPESSIWRKKDAESGN